MGLSLKNLAKKAWDQVNPLDNGRTWQNSQGNNKPGVAAPSALQQIKSEISHVPSQARRAGIAVGLGAVRSATGMAQGATGLYDLATPGRGTSRYSKSLNRFAQFTDQTAQNEHVDPFLYHAAQTGTDLLSMATGGGELAAGAKALSKGAQVSKFLMPATEHVVPQLIKAGDKLLPAEDAVGRAAQTAVKSFANPKNQAANLLYTAKATGENASKGNKTTPLDVAMNYGMGVGADVGLPVLGSLAKSGVTSAVHDLRTPAVPAPKPAPKPSLTKKVDTPAPVKTPDLPIASAAKAITRKVKDAREQHANSKYDFLGRERVKKDKPTLESKSASSKPSGSKKQPYQQVDEINRGLKTKLKEKVVDEDAHIIDNLRNIEKKTGRKGLVDKFLFTSGEQRRSNGIANNDIVSSQHIHDAFGGMDKKSHAAFSDYANARRELSYAKDKATSQSRKSLQKIVDGAPAEFDQRYQSLNKYWKTVAEKLRANGRLSEEQFKRYTDNNEYVRLSRDMEDVVNAHHGSGHSYSGGGNSASHSVKGSKRKAVDVFHATLEHSQRLHNEIAKNSTASHLIDTLEASGQATALVKADHVKFRREVYKFLSETREGSKAVDRVLKRQSKKMRQLQSEIDHLNKEGLERRLKADRTQRDAPLLTYQRDKVNNLHTDVTPEKSKEIVKYGRKEKMVLRPRREETSGTMQTDFGSRSMSSREVRSLVKNLITEDPKKLRRIHNKLDARYPVLKQLMDDVEQLKNESEAFHTARSQAWQAARDRADLATVHKNTITRYVDGVKEVYEVSPDMKRAIERINPFELTAATKILAAPGRLLRAGTTGLNPVFNATNYLRDQAGSGIMSEHTFSTHNPQRIIDGFGKALADGFGIDVKDPMYKAFLRTASDTTSYDLTRNARGAKRVLRSVQGGAKNRTINVISNPIRSLEDLNSITEKATRFQNFKGEYQRAIKEGADHDEAIQHATLAAWHNSVDFNRVGQWSRLLNLAIPYWNPGVQGVRQLGRSVSKHPVGTIGKTAGAVMVPVAAATAWNLSDPERKKIYSNLSDYEKENNLIIIPPGSKNNDQNPDKTYDVWKVPLPPGIGQVGNVVRRAMESHDNMNPGVMAKMANDMLGVVSGPINTQSLSQIGNSFTPQFAKPVINQLANKDQYTGKQIVPDYINKATDADGNPIREGDKTYKFTSGTAQLVGQLTNKSPIRIQKAIKDTAGGVGMNLLNAADNVLAKAGVISHDQIGGQSVKEGFSRRFAKAQGNEDVHATAAQKHFGYVADAIKSVGLNQNELDLYNSAVHPQGKNFLGEPINEKTPVDPMLRAAAYIKSDKLWQVDKEADKLARRAGQPGNPIYDLNGDQRRALLAIQMLPPDDRDKQKLQADNKSWLDGYYRKSSDFYDKVLGSKNKQAQAAAGINPIWQSPTASDTVQRKLDAMSQITDSKAKSAYIKENQDLTDYLAASDQATRAKRAWLGLPALKGYPTPDAGTQKLLDQFDALPQHDGSKGGNKSRYLFVQAHPGLADWFNKVSDYSSAQKNQFDVYEGVTSGSGSGSGGSSGGSSNSGSSSSSKGYTDSNGTFHYYSSGGSGGTSNYDDARYLSNSQALTVKTNPVGSSKIKGNTVSVSSHSKGKSAIKGRSKSKAVAKPKLTKRHNKA